MTQPIATIIAACVALLAAGITLFGVKLNIAHQTNLDERKADREREEVRRLERMTQFAEVLSLVSKTNQLAWARMSRALTAPTDDEFSSALDLLSMAAFRLELLGYAEQALAVDVYAGKLVDAWLAMGSGHERQDGSLIDPDEAAQVMKAVSSARKDLVASFKVAANPPVPVD
ncbi:MAG: hypothetical protein QME72_13165 [Rhodococcus sp. (in: high G+C Gram-positive bacteria)]|nr:hypothetical protein [Rhodococcus sp. (in: high G+C Gram-positive bacteria)]MDI6628658.1 hypothetical protein [Rhodococcus sp. (in: high G+C Gram-positive bacteria)]